MEDISRAAMMLRATGGEIPTAMRAGKFRGKNIVESSCPMPQPPRPTSASSATNSPPKAPARKDIQNSILLSCKRHERRELHLG